jgi:hypothetical protein
MSIPFQITSSDPLKAPIASPTFTGATTATTRLQVSALLAPAPLVVTPTGGTGAVTWSYTIFSVDAYGQWSAIGRIGSTSTGVASLNGTTYNALTWSAQPNAVSYKIYRTAVGTSPSTTGLISTTSGTSLNDTGLAGDGTAVPVPPTGLNLFHSYTDDNHYDSLAFWYDIGFSGFTLGTRAGSQGGTAQAFALGVSGSARWFIDTANGRFAWCPGNNNTQDIGRIWGSSGPAGAASNIGLPRYIVAQTGIEAAFGTNATSGANQTSGSLQCVGSYWTGSAAASDIWGFQNVLGSGSNPTSTLTLTHTGSSGISKFSVVGTVDATAFTVSGSPLPTTTLLTKQGVQSAVTTVSGVDTTLFTFTLPGGTLGPNDEIWVQTSFKITSNAVSTAFKIAFGATSGTVNTTSATGTSAWDCHIGNNGSTSSQVWYQPPGSNGNAFLGPGVGATSAIDTSSDVVVKITANAASNTETITPEYFAVYLIRHA